MDRITPSVSSTTNGTSSPVASNHIPTTYPDKNRYLAALASWVGTEANGKAAADKIERWLDKGDVNAVLNLSQLGIHNLPPLPGNLQRLKADRNQLTAIPENHLPATLTALDVHGNQLASLPESLPIAHLRLLNAAGNNLTGLPLAAFVLDPACKVFFTGNNLDSALLAKHFGPEQNRDGMRQASTASNFLAAQAEAVKRLANAISAWMPPADLDLQLFSQDVPGMTSFASFLNQMKMAPYVKDAELIDAVTHVIKKMSADPALCKYIFEITMATDIQSHYHLPYLFFNIRQSVIHADIQHGRYSGKIAQFVEVIRQQFRADAILKWGTSRLVPSQGELLKRQTAVWGEIATFISPFIQLDLKIEPIDNTNKDLAFDIIELTQIIPQQVKDWENKEFPTYFSDRNSAFASRLKQVDPQLGKIMDNDIDENGNKLDGDELKKFHARQMSNYFKSIGQENVLEQVWPSIDNPMKFTMEFGEMRITPPPNVNANAFMPEHLQQPAECRMQ